MTSNYSKISFSLLILVFFLLFTRETWAVTLSGTVRASSPLLKSFGGTIILAPIPFIKCTGIGKSTLLTSNISGLIDIAKSAASAPSKSKAIRIAAGIYKMIPTYTTNPRKVPIPGKQILGNEKLIPDLKTCYITAGPAQIPIPVFKTTDNYGVSTNQSLQIGQ